MLAERGRQTALPSHFACSWRASCTCCTVTGAARLPQLPADSSSDPPPADRSTPSRKPAYRTPSRAAWLAYAPSSTTRSAVSGLSAVTVALPASAGMAKSVPSPCCRGRSSSTSRRSPCRLDYSPARQAQRLWRRFPAPVAQVHRNGVQIAVAEILRTVGHHLAHRPGDRRMAAAAGFQQRRHLFRRQAA